MRARFSQAETWAPPRGAGAIFAAAGKALVLAALLAALAVGGARPCAAASWWERLLGVAPGDEAGAPKASPQEGGEPAAAAAPSGPIVPVMRPKVQSVTDYLEVTGNAASVNTVKLIARVEGYLEKLHFADGARVKKGDLLFTIQQDQYKAQLTQAKAQVAVQEAALVHARTEVARYTALVRKDAATQVEVDQWVFQFKAAEAQLLSAKAQVDIANLNLSYTEVRAPFDGLMGKHLVDPGNTVGGPGQQTVLAEIMQLDPIYVVANLSEPQLLAVRANLGQRRLSLAEIVETPVDVGLENGTDFPYRGNLEYVAPGIDPTTGTYFVRGLLKNPDLSLLPGIFVRVRLPKGHVAQNALLVPSRALGEDQGGRFLLVVNANDVVEQRYVETAESVGTMRVIASGLKPDDRVIIGELWRAAPGTKVTPRMAEASSAGSSSP